jgi:tyrosyl-tRNA synthetase
MKLSELLTERGYVYQQSGASLEEITDGPKRTLYLGVDPTADSMHVGHLMGFLVLRRFLEGGHKIIILTGGGTGMIGDPGGKSEERNLLDEATIAHNAQAVAAQIRKVFGSSDFIEENNAKWLTKLNLIEFLRDIGKHFTVNSMIKKDTVKTRLDAESPLSFTEFSYSLLQGYDFLHLHQEYGCDVQVGGSDQWTNILSGAEFIRRKTGDTVYAYTWPLIVNKSTGRKFGKSEGGAVWLDAAKTSPFDFYQFWFNTDDADVEEFLLKMTLLPKTDIDAVMAEQKENPASRAAQKNLAFEVTALVHGEEEAEKVAKASEDLFSGASSENAPTVKVDTGITLVDALVQSNLAASKREARQFITDGAVQVNGEKISDESRIISEADFKEGKAILKRGKRNIVALTL